MDEIFIDETSGCCDTYDDSGEFDVTSGYDDVETADYVEYVETPSDVETVETVEYVDVSSGAEYVEVTAGPSVVVEGWGPDDSSAWDGSWTPAVLDPAAAASAVEATVALPVPDAGTIDPGSVWQPVSPEQAVAWGLRSAWQPVTPEQAAAWGISPDPVGDVPDPSVVTAQMQNEAAANRLLWSQFNHADNGMSIPGLYGAAGDRNWIETSPNFSDTSGWAG